MDQENVIVMNLDDAITIREWSVQGIFSWSVPEPTTVDCISMIGQPFIGTYY